MKDIVELYPIMCSTERKSFLCISFGHIFAFALGIFYQTAQLGLVNPRSLAGRDAAPRMHGIYLFLIKEYNRDGIMTFYQKKYPSCNQWPVVELKTLNHYNSRHTYPFWMIFGQDERSR